jgi:hypothetical protein
MPQYNWGKLPNPAGSIPHWLQHMLHNRGHVQVAQPQHPCARHSTYHDSGVGVTPKVTSAVHPAEQLLVQHALTQRGLHTPSHLHLAPCSAIPSTMWAT